jgi:hypothetical protein
VTYVKELFAYLAQESQINSVFVHGAAQLFAISHGNFSALQLFTELRNNFLLQFVVQPANVFFVVFLFNAWNLSGSLVTCQIWKYRNVLTWNMVKASLLKAVGLCFKSSGRIKL